MALANFYEGIFKLLNNFFVFFRQWLRYEGRWGNPSSKCHIGFFGFCEIANGPHGIPVKRVNFPCHNPYHSTFTDSEP